MTKHLDQWNVKLESQTPYFWYKVAAGKIEGLSHVFKFGYNAAVSSTEETIWSQGGIYAYLSAAKVLKVSSSDADDTSAGGGGSGARTVRIFGLDGNYALVQEDVSLTGQTAVNTTNSYLRVYRAYVLTAGATGQEEGDIYVGDGTVTSGIPATKYAKIQAGYGQTELALYTIPAGKKGYIHRLIASSFGNANVFLTVRFMTREIGGVWRTRDIFTVSRGEVIIDHDIPIEVPEKTDIEVRATSSGVDVDCSAAFSIVMEDQ